MKLITRQCCLKPKGKEIPGRKRLMHMVPQLYSERRRDKWFGEGRGILFCATARDSDTAATLWPRSPAKRALGKTFRSLQERACANEQRGAGSSKNWGCNEQFQWLNRLFPQVLWSTGRFSLPKRRCRWRTRPCWRSSVRVAWHRSRPPHGSTLTRSSSSDSLRSVHGKPGLCAPNYTEIEARMRLAGLTVPSRLNRSNSLAKLGSLTFSSEDLCSACSSDAGTLLMLSLSPEPERSLSPEWARPWSSSSTSTSTNMDVFNQVKQDLKSPRADSGRFSATVPLVSASLAAMLFWDMYRFFKTFSHLGTLSIHGRVNMSGRVSYTNSLLSVMNITITFNR